MPRTIIRIQDKYSDPGQIFGSGSASVCTRPAHGLQKNEETQTLFLLKKSFNIFVLLCGIHRENIINL